VALYSHVVEDKDISLVRTICYISVRITSLHTLTEAHMAKLSQVKQASELCNSLTACGK